ENLPDGAEFTVLHEELARNFWDDFRHVGPNGYNDENNEANTRAALKIGSNNLDVLVHLQEAEQLAGIHHVKVEGHGGLGHGISRVYMEGLPEDLVAYINKLRAK